MITNIFSNNFPSQKKQLQEIEYLNYLVGVVYDRLFEKLVSVNKVDKLKELYNRTFTENQCIVIPRENILAPERTFSRKEKTFLKSPKSILKDLDLADKYFYIYTIKEANLVNLDKYISSAFSTKRTIEFDSYLVVLNKDTRLKHYEDIVYGIASNRCCYNENLSFVQFLQKDLLKKAKKSKMLYKFLVYYTVGTTAISAKNFKFT